jgi:hypothetical protein
LLIGVVVYLTIREPVRGRLDAIVDEVKPSLLETCDFFGFRRRHSTSSWAAVSARCGAGA